MKSIFISGPVSSDDKVHGKMKNVIALSEVQLECYKKGWDDVECFGKELLWMENAELPHEFWVEKSIAKLSKYDTILMMPGWQYSRGAKAEFEYAMRNHITIYYYDIDGVPEAV